MMRNVCNTLVNKLEVKRSFGRPRRMEKARRQWGKSVGMRIGLTRLKTETCGGLLWHAVETGVSYIWQGIDTIRNQRCFKHSDLLCSALLCSALLCSVLFFSVLFYRFRRPPLWSSGQSFWLQIQRSRVRFPALSDFLSSSGSGTGSTQPREVN